MKHLFFAVTILMAVVLTTGVSFSKLHKDKVTCTVETEKSVLFAGPSQEVVIKVTLDAPMVPSSLERPPVNLSIVLDKSGSMNGEKIRQAKAAAIEAVQRLGVSDIFSLVVYDSNVHTIIPAQNVRDIDQIISKINRISASGSTALFGGVSQGASEIRKYIGSEHVHRIILVSDGLANVGPASPAELGRLGAALIKENISVTTIGVGYDYNEDLMTRLSQKSDGNSYFVETGSELPHIFASELGDVLNVVAKKVKVAITMPDGVEPISIIGREGRIKGRTIELSMNQLYGDQEKYALVKVKIPKSDTGVSMEIAKAKVRYENPFSKKTEVVYGKSIVKFSKDYTIVKKSTNVDVVREYQRNLNALEQEKAISLSDKGKKKEAVQALKASAVKMKSIAKEYNDEVLLEEAEDMEKQAETIETEGMNKKMRKVLRTKSYQMKNQ
ncbi:MAG: VWA domain-containing protein, partial [Desulfobacteraceae bacterium]|nr:VWA domain-containing protein [Desulfobacteraceae bacterium]